MQIQWFPGHMHKARKEITAALRDVDLVVELLDARIPFSSANPMLADMRGDKLVVKVLTKSDLADEEWLREWKEYFSGEGVRTVCVTTERPGGIRALPTQCRKAYMAAGGSRERLALMVAGIPNVGKSTLINILAGRSVAKTGNEPAVTRQQQRIELDAGMMLLDTPGVLWPNVENAHSGYRLAATGAIRDTALSHVEVALYLVAFLRQHYWEPLMARYRLDHPDESATALLESIGSKRGCLKKGGIVDLDRAAKILLTEFREGVLGRISLETPQMMMRELEEVAAARERKAAKKRERKEKWKKGRQG